MNIYERTVAALYVPGDHIELRCWDKKHTAYVGIYTYEALPKVIAELDKIVGDDALDLYILLNPTSLELRGLRAGAKATWEHEVISRRWFLLDGDAITKTDKHIATPEEFAATLAVMRKVRDWLNQQGFDKIIVASSGNGVHLLVRCDLPNDKEAKELVRHVQNAAAKKFSDDTTKIDCLCDAGRIVRCYGTLNRKGQETDTYKWRRSEIIEGD